MVRKQTPLRPYFEKMNVLGKVLSAKEKERSEKNVDALKDIENNLQNKVEKLKQVGTPVETIHKRGEMTGYERIEYLVDSGTWLPFHSLLNPAGNEEGRTNVISGMGKIEGRWAVIVAFNNQMLAGAWVAGMPEQVMRATDMAKRLNIPLVWVLQCSGVKLTDAHKNLFPKRDGGGATFYRNAELNDMGIPVLSAIYGTNPAGGGYHGISPTILIAHKDSNIAVGGLGIVGGMSPKGHFDLETVQQVIEATKAFKHVPPGRVDTHYDKTGFFREVHDTETSVLDSIKEYMQGLPAYDPRFFRVAEPATPLYEESDLYNIVPLNPKLIYDTEQVLARLTDGSEFMEYRSNYGPEVFCGIAKMNGLPVAMIGNKQGFLQNYPEYANGAYMGIGGKLYRQGMIKMAEFVTLCDRDNLPIIWVQDSTGIDVGDLAEEAELLGIGQSVLYSIQKTNLSMMTLVLRKATAAAHYVLGGPQGSDNNAFIIGSPATEVYVMHGETAAVATYARRLVKEQEAGNNLEPVIEKMNELVDLYHQKSRPDYSAENCFVDEIVPMDKLRAYCLAFVEANYQNPRSITPVHQMILPRTIKG